MRVTRPGVGESSVTVALPPSMCTTSFPSRGVARPHAGGGEGGGAGARAAGLGDAGAALVDAHADLVLALGPARTISRLTCGHLEHRAPARSTTVTSSTPTTLCGLPRLRCSDRAIGMAAELVPARRVRRCGSTAPMSTLASIVSRVVGRSTASRSRSPASVRIRCGTMSPRRVASAWAKQRMPLPLISARLPSALNSTIARRVAVRPDSPTSSPSAPIPRRRSHTRRASAGRSSTCGWNTTRKSLPSPWCLVSVSVLMRRVLPPRSVPTRRPGRRSTSTQRTRGSRRNHRSCRTANWRVRTTICSTALVERLRAVEVGEQLLVAERLGGGPRQARRPQRRAPRRRDRRRSSRARAARSAPPARRGPSAGRSARPASADRRRDRGRTS